MNNMFYETLNVIMKKNIWIWAIAALLMTACSKHDDPIAQEPEQSVTDDDFEGLNGQVVIQLGGGDYIPSSNTTVTRAPISNTTFANGNTIIGVYAASTTGAWNTTGNLLLDNRMAKVTNTERTEAEGADMSKTNADADNPPLVTVPYKISLFNKDGDTEGQVEYYPMMSTKNYAFYGYAPYDKVNNTVTTTTASNVAFNNFNGSQDIIWGKGEAAAINGADIWIKANQAGSGTINGYNAKYIRMLKYHYELNATAANKKTNYPWVPNIKFGHQLVQLKFYVIPATSQSTQDQENASKLFVSNIRIQNHGKPTLAVNTGAITWDGTDELSMFDVTGGATFTDNIRTTTMHPTDDVIVGYLLVKPGQTSYNLLLDISPFKTDNLEDTANKQKDIPVTISFGGKTFDAGCSYNIKLGIYAMQQIEADASLTDWTDKGNVNIDVE